jgi:hypothetical protein
MTRVGLPPVALLFGASMLMAIACGPSGSGGDGDGDGDQGDSCETATNCAGELVCDPDTNECVADKPCTGHAECGNGGHCNTGTGFCAPSQTGSPCDADVSCQEGEACVGAGGANGGFCGCDGEEFEATPVEPNMLIALDRSGSMDDGNSEVPGTGGKNRMEVAQEAITQMMGDFGGQIRFGLSMYPGPDRDSNNCDPGEVDIDPAAGTAQDVADAVNATDGDGNTPLGATLEALANYSGLQDPDRPNYVISIQDGAPNCPSSGASTRVVNATADLFDLGIRTFVIGFGGGLTDNERETLDDMAVAGGTARMMGAENYYRAESPEELEDAFNEIGGSVLACSFALNADAEAQVFVYGDGMPLEFMYDRDTMTVTVLGVDCDSLRVGDITELVVVNSCPIGVD